MHPERTFYPVPLSEQIFHCSTKQEDLASHSLLSVGLASGNDAKYFGASGVERKYPEKDPTFSLKCLSTCTQPNPQTDCKQNSCYLPTDIKMFKNMHVKKILLVTLTVHSTLTLCYKMTKKALTYNWKV